MTAATIRAIPIADIATTLRGDEAIAALAFAMEELAIAQMLVMVHGPERAPALYIERGGHVRFNDTGEPVLLWDGAGRSWFA